MLSGLCTGPQSPSLWLVYLDGHAWEFTNSVSGKYKLVKRPGGSHEGVGRHAQVFMLYGYNVRHGIPGVWFSAGTFLPAGRTSMLHTTSETEAGCLTLVQWLLDDE